MKPSWAEEWLLQPTVTAGGLCASSSMIQEKAESMCVFHCVFIFLCVALWYLLLLVSLCLAMTIYKGLVLPWNLESEFVLSWNLESEFD